MSLVQFFLKTSASLGLKILQNQINQNQMGKYSDIRRGVELNAALTKLRAWEDLSRDAKQSLYAGQKTATGTKVNLKTVKGYVESFTFNGRVFLPVRLIDDAGQTSNGVMTTSIISTLRTAVAADDRTRAANFTVPTGGVKMDGLKGFKPAKASLVIRGAAVADNKSRVTDIQYKRYANKSISSPFGQSTDGSETYATAVTAIAATAALVTLLETEGNRLSFTPEIV
ncbi:hypothetical protein [Calothrix sp. NIES-2098]|uniref:hypothetical protein n=1 Tax=Calothrix sp. NIES-2098 TaxID=1954171 RepID=UPI0030DA9E04